MPGADQNAAVAGPQTRHMALAAHEILRGAARVGGHLHCSGAVVRRGSGGDACAGVDARGEGSGLRVDALRWHQVEAEAVADSAVHGQANQAAGLPHHEVDGFRRGVLRRDDHIALVFTVRVVNHDDHPPGAKFVERLVNRAKAFAKA